MEEHMLSTVDNPFNPFKQFEDWRRWDEKEGYNTLGLLARIINTSDDLADTDADVALENAIDEIVRENVMGVHIKVTENDAAPRKKALSSV